MVTLLSGSFSRTTQQNYTTKRAEFDITAYIIPAANGE
jgi:hypothetical protein